jgi:hypothetical protein
MGGTGKSYIIAALLTLFEKKKVQFRVLSFTGSSAFLAGGITIHRCLQLGYNYRRKDPTTNVTAIRRSLKKVTFYLIDEVSLLGKS